MKSAIGILLGTLLILGPIFWAGLGNGADTFNSVVDVANAQGTESAAWGGLIILAAPLFIGFLLLAKGMTDDD